MADKLMFWQSWDRPYRLVFWLLLVAMLALAVATVVLQMVGAGTLIGWNVLTQESSYTIDFSVFTKGPFSFSIPADKKVLTEVFNGGAIPAGVIYSQALMAVVAVAIWLFLALVTMFRRVGYLITMGALLAFLILLHVETLQLFNGSDTGVLVLVFIIILSPSYYLHAFAPAAGFVKRLWVMAAALALLGVIVYFFSSTRQPFTGLINYGVLAPYMLVILFIVSVAHEIVALFLTVITGTKGIASRSKLRHFLLITLIYLANILFSYLYVAHYIDWQLLYINPFVLLVISAVLGVWGSYHRAALYEGAANYKILWPTLYLVIAVTSLATLTFFMFTLNDPFLKVLGDIIIYAHLAIGIAFLLYVLYNFLPLIEQDYKVGRVLYQPTNLPYFTYRILAIMILVGLFSMRGFEYPIWYSMGGYSNVKADLALANGHLEVAEAYYENGDAFAHHNHKSNYTLGMMKALHDPQLSMQYFAHAMDQQPSAQTVVNRASLQNFQQDFYNGLFTLQQGNKLVPADYHLQNNLALQFARLKILDSAAYYFSLAGTSNPQVKNNRLAFKAMYNRPVGRDSAAIFNHLNRAGKANAAALGVVAELPGLTNADHMFDMVWLNNWLLAGVAGVQDSSLYRARAIIDSTTNLAYKEQLLYSWSLAAYRAGNVARATEGLAYLGFNSTEWSERARLALAKIYLQLGTYQQAIEVFTSLGEEQLSLELAVAYLENGNPGPAREFWLAAAEGDDDFLVIMARDILATVYTDAPVLDSDSRRYLYGRYQRFYLDETAENQLLQQITNPEMRIGLALDLAEHYHHFDNPRGARLMLQNIAALPLNKEQYRQYLLLSALINKDSEHVQQQLVAFDSLFEFRADEYLLAGVLHHYAGMTLDSLDYLAMARDNPFFPDAVLAGVRFFDADDDPFRGYSLLAKAVQANPGSPLLLKAYIFKALDVGLEQFAEKAMYEYRQRFSGQAYMLLKAEYDKKVQALNGFTEDELLE